VGVFPQNHPYDNFFRFVNFVALGGDELGERGLVPLSKRL